MHLCPLFSERARALRRFALLFASLFLVPVAVLGQTTHFSVTAPATATAGSGFSITVTALDASNATVTTYSGTVHFTSSDGTASAGNGLPANYTFVGGDNGSHTFTSGVTLKTAGSQTVTATDVVTSSIKGMATVAVSAAGETHFVVTAPGSATAGVQFSITITAEDTYGNTVTTDNQLLHFGSLDGQAVLPAYCAASSLVNGVGTANLTLKTAGSQTVSAYGCSVGISGTSAAIAVSPGVVTHFVVNAPGGATAGAAFSFTVTAQDTGNNTVPTYSGTVQFTSSDTNPSVVLPPNHTLTSGTGSFMATLITAGSQTITATDTLNSALTNTSSNITVTGAAATHLSVSAPASTTAGSGFSITVTALDQFGNTDPNYTGSVHFSSSDPQATNLPPNSPLPSGTASFSNVILKTAGSQTITARDVVTGSITGFATISVSPAGESKFVVTAPSTATAGVQFSATITAKDAYGNTVTTDSQLLHFGSLDGQAVLPAYCAASSLVNGVGTANITLKTAGSQTVSAYGCSVGISGTSPTIAVSPGAVTHFVVNVPAGATAGVAFSFTVIAQDTGNNTVPTYSGMVVFSSSDTNPSVVLPPKSSLTSGTGSFMATLVTAGTQNITATDSVNSNLTNMSSNITVTGAAATKLGVSAPVSVNAGTGFSITVTAQDPYGNTDPTYSGTVHFSSSDAQATGLPPNSTLSSGTGTFSSVVLKTVGSQTITARDTVTGSITGFATVSVNPGSETHFAVTAPATATAGIPFSVNVQAKDGSGNNVTTDPQALYFTSTDSAVSPGNGLPANCVNSLSNGAGSFNVTLKTVPGPWTVTAIGCTNFNSGTSGQISVMAAGVTHFSVTVPGTATAGSAFSITVKALDGLNGVVTSYSGTVHFTSTDGAAMLPADYTFVAGDSGTHTFNATLKTAGTQMITATDIGNGTLTGTSSGIALSGASASHFSISAPGGANPGSGFTFTVKALDPFGNTDANYAGAVHFTSSDGHATLPPDSSLASGTGTFPATLNSAGSQTISATDTSNGSITGISATVSVASLSFTVGVSHQPANRIVIGGKVTFTSTVTNKTGATVANVVGTVTLSGAFYIVSTSSNVGSCVGSGKGPVSCNLGTMSNLQTATITVTITPVWPAKNITAQASADVTTNTANDTAHAQPKPFIN